MKSILYAAVMRMLAAALLGMSALVVVPQSAYALDAEYSALTKALDNLHDAYTDLNKIDAKIKAHEGKVMGQDPWTFGNRFARNYYKKRDELLGERKKILTRIKRLKSEVKKKAADFNRAMKPFNDLRRDALRKYQAIQASSSGNPSNKRRALAAISNDLEKLQGSVFNKQIQMLDTVTRLIRVGRPLEEVKEQLQDLVGNDMDKVFADALIDVINDNIKENLPEGNLLTSMDQKLGKLMKLVKVYKIMAGGTTDPLGNEDIERVINAVDLTSDVIPADFLPVVQYTKIQKFMVENIYKSFKALSLAEAKSNLNGLYVHGTTEEARIVGDLWTGLHPNILFGTIPPDPRLSTDKTQYASGKTITVNYEGSWRWINHSRFQRDKGWIGLIPTGVMHGSSDENDRHDVAYFYLDAVSGHTTFTAPAIPGSYDIRMFDSDPLLSGDGKEVTSTTIQVVGTSGANVTISKRTFQPGEPISAAFTAPGSFATDAWVGLIPADIAHGSEAENDKHDLDYAYLNGRTSGTMRFTAPVTEGVYDLRMNDTDEDGKEVASVTFRVKEPKTGSTYAIHSFNGHRYLLTPWKMLYGQAQTYARSIGGNLVTVNDQAEQDFLTKTFVGNGLLWIGYNDAASEGHFVWVSGQHSTFTAWADGEPNNMWGGDGEDYAVMFWSGGGKWNDLGKASPEWHPYYGLIEIDYGGQAPPAAPHVHPAHQR